jgi:predicted alpha/beta-fold hydrolase
MSYTPPFFLFNTHLETIFPALFRKVSAPAYVKERIDTPDNDFLDINWLITNSDKVVIIQHGLEGNADRAYIRGMAKIFFNHGFNVLAWNYRGCGAEMNRQLRFYHSGATDDLHTIIEYAISKKKMREVYLVGFSLGGNITLKYLGERTVSPYIRRAAVFSVPVDLESSCRKISIPGNRIYARRFVKSLKAKIASKAAKMQGLDTTPLQKIKSLLEFDNAYTAPLHGFKNAVDYYTRCSAINFLNQINIPTLIVNTRNDPFLSEECFPEKQLQEHPYVKLEIPDRGGHVGFTQLTKTGHYWSEHRALDWILNNQ